MTGSQVIIEEFHSRTLEGNPLGDPVMRRVPVYLPPGYDAKRRYPSLYLLSAFGNRGLKFMNDDLWEENIQQRLDRLIGTGRVQPLIVVMPDASTRYGGSQYVNSSATGQYEDHILELVEYMDGKYSTEDKPSARAVAGHSSGGFAALRFGMLHPDIFGLVADHSGDKWFEMTFKPFFPELLRYFDKVGETGLAALLADPAFELQKGASHEALNLMAMASCFSPNPASKLGFDLPIDLHTGIIRPDVWARWLAFDPIENVAKHADALRSLKLIYFDCGKGDEYNLLYGTRLLTQKLSELKIPFTFEEYEGGHRNMKHRYDVSFAAISAAFS
ncbi:MAG: alpha/beta hydrolase-fold protein [Anaerolineales bacterium]